MSSLVPAPAELTAYVCAARPDLDPGDVRGAITALQTAGQSWEQINLAVALMINHRETPHDLRAAARKPDAPWKDPR